MPLMSCWVKTSMPARLVLRRPPRSGKPEALPGGRKTSNGGNPASACPVGKGGRGGSATGGNQGSAYALSARSPDGDENGTLPLAMAAWRADPDSAVDLGVRRPALTGRLRRLADGLGFLGPLGR